jgi:hypothetical protein
VPRGRKIVPRHHRRAPGADFHDPEARLAITEHHREATGNDLKAIRHQRLAKPDLLPSMSSRLGTTPGRFHPARAHVTPATRGITPTTPQAITTADHFTPSLAQREIVARDRKTIPHDFHVLRGRFPTTREHITPATREITPTTPQAITTADHFTPSLAQRKIIARDRKTIPHRLHVLRDRFPTPGDRLAPAQPRPPTPRRHAPCTLVPR